MTSTNLIEFWHVRIISLKMEDATTHLASFACGSLQLSETYLLIESKSLAAINEKKFEFKIHCFLCRPININVTGIRKENCG